MERLTDVGAERIGAVRFGNTQEDERAALDRLAQSVDGGVVVASSELDLADVIANLSRQLPWVH